MATGARAGVAVPLPGILTWGRGRERSGYRGGAELDFGAGWAAGDAVDAGFERWAATGADHARNHFERAAMSDIQGADGLEMTAGAEQGEVVEPQLARGNVNASLRLRERAMAEDRPAILQRGEPIDPAVARIAKLEPGAARKRFDE